MEFVGEAATEPPLIPYYQRCVYSPQPQPEYQTSYSRFRSSISKDPKKRDLLLLVRVGHLTSLVQYSIMSGCRRLEKLLGEYGNGLGRLVSLFFYVLALSQDLN